MVDNFSQAVINLAVLRETNSSVVDPYLVNSNGSYYPPQEPGLYVSLVTMAQEYGIPIEKGSICYYRIDELSLISPSNKRLNLTKFTNFHGCILFSRKTYFNNVDLSDGTMWIHDKNINMFNIYTNRAILTFEDYNGLIQNSTFHDSIIMFDSPSSTTGVITNCVFDHVQFSRRYKSKYYYAIINNSLFIGQKSGTTDILPGVKNCTFTEWNLTGSVNFQGPVVNSFFLGDVTNTYCNQMIIYTNFINSTIRSSSFNNAYKCNFDQTTIEKSVFTGSTESNDFSYTEFDKCSFNIFDSDSNFMNATFYQSQFHSTTLFLHPYKNVLLNSQLIDSNVDNLKITTEPHTYYHCNLGHGLDKLGVSVKGCGLLDPNSFSCKSTTYKIVLIGGIPLSIILLIATLILGLKMYKKPRYSIPRKANRKLDNHLKCIINRDKILIREIITYGNYFDSQAVFDPVVRETYSDIRNNLTRRKVAILFQLNNLNSRLSKMKCISDPNIKEAILKSIIPDDIDPDLLERIDQNIKFLLYPKVERSSSNEETLLIN